MLPSGGSGVRVEAVVGAVTARYGSWATLSVNIDSDPYPTLEEVSWYKVNNYVKRANKNHSYHCFFYF